MTRWLTPVACLLQLLAVPAAALAQTNLAGNWQGTVVMAGTPLRVGLVLAQDAGRYRGTMVVIDQDNATMAISEARLTGDALHLDIPGIRGTFEGTVTATEITGAFMQQGNPIAITFRRVAALDPAPVFDDQSNAQVTAVVHDYFAAFSRKDYEALGNTEAVPFLRWFVGGTPNVASSISDVVAVSRTTREGLDSADYARSRAVEMIITPLSASAAMVDVHWRRDRKDGSLLQEGAEILTLLKTPTGWRINSVIGRSLSHYGKRF